MIAQVVSMILMKKVGSGVDRSVRKTEEQTERSSLWRWLLQWHVPGKRLQVAEIDGVGQRFSKVADYEQNDGDDKKVED